MSCNIHDSGKSLRVCFTDTVIYYRFGAAGQAPELELIDQVGTVNYTPWPGLGRAIWEAVIFENNDYSYEVFGGFDRMFGDETDADHPPPHFGGVQVTRGNEVINVLTCARETVEFAWGEGLFAAKNNLGLVWDFDSKQWVELRD